MMISMYGTTQAQVDGLIQVRVLVLEYSRANTRVEYMSVRHKHDTMTHVMSTNQQVKSCEIRIGIFQILKKFIQFTWKQLTHKCFAREHQLALKWYHNIG